MDDVIVAGAGLAGLRAARDLNDRGLAVAVVEARDRVGGRGFTTNLGGRPAELGGSWFTPEHDQVRAELGRYGLAVRDFPPVRHARWLTGGELRQGLPVPWAELPALERALARVLRDAEAAAAGDLAIAGISARDYVESLHVGAAARDFLLGWWVVMGGAPPERGAVIDALASIHDHGGLAGVIGCLAHAPAAGWSALADALASTPGLTLHTGWELAAVEHNDAGVTCVARDGRVLTARALVLALPLNCLPAIAATPPLPGPVADAAGANAGAAVKLLMLAGGIEPHGIAVGAGPGLNWLYADELRDGSVLVTGFGWQDERHPLDDDGSVARALAAFYPAAELAGWARHDWIGDPASRGTWLTAPAGRVELLDPARFRPAGRIAFAGSDVAAEQAGWFEGALRSGAAAADDILAMLG